MTTCRPSAAVERHAAGGIIAVIVRRRRGYVAHAHQALRA